ncbi:MAG: serine/threonine-protein kinase [Kofleriaceae bacterium]
MDIPIKPFPALRRHGEHFADHYQLGDILGVGRMGVVYIASQRRVEGTVAIKVPRPELVDDPYVHRRFREELNAGKRLLHRNIALTMGGGLAQGSPYIVMEHVTGCSLTYLRSEVRPIGIEPAVRLILDVLAGLAAMHRAGVIHGDVNSDNVLVAMQRDGTTLLKLIDLGLARLVDDHGAGEWDGMLSSDPAYLAPEMIAGHPPTFATDQYGVGVMLYELIAGRGHQDHALPLAQQRADLGCAAALDAIIARTRANDPAARFPGLGALAAALQDLASAASSPEASSDAPTGEWLIETPKFRRGAVSNHDSLRVASRRHALEHRISNGELAPVVDAYLNLVSALVEERQISGAIDVLREGIARLQRNGDVSHIQGLWRLELSIAALHAGHGDQMMAVKFAQAAQDHARLCGSVAGGGRASWLIARLARPRPRPRPRPKARKRTARDRLQHGAGEKR